MNSMTMMPRSDMGLAQPQFATLKAKRGQMAPLAGIIALHVVALYLFQSGLLSKAVHAAMPEVINISFVTPPAPPKETPPSLPKTVDIVAPQPPAIIPPLPLLAIAPAEPTITPPQAPAESAPAAAVAAPPAPPQKPAPATPRTVSSVEYIKAPQPVYPNISRRLGETGIVVLRILISEKGLPEQVMIQKSSGSSNLDEAGRQAALRALFKPLIENGKAVSVFVIVPLNFQLS
ncbi:energy transducer TonB [Janthinobacterium agaricidamnosum]|uniref:TonB family C-terminal domain protein n=1 Tax=Janthinobacterium agaricidamnosum NBRC 102515 = DSM 9628 TaxID=1349767 RepID=W0UX03_9BURK|nr:energy transducer TonB [Janthinobacterium agaricidamnosum]CDG81004.1 tonB family C-terminal domain protein [Janthinobacterium agaricidamnosum NBRC 102515 = DSM 9628]